MIINENMKFRCKYSNGQWWTCFTYNCSIEFSLERRSNRQNKFIL